MSLPPIRAGRRARILISSFALLTTSLAACSSYDEQGADSSSSALGEQRASVAPGPRRVQVSAGAVKQLLSAGGALVADYGSYALVDVDASKLSALPKNSFELRDEYRKVLLNAGSIDSSDPASARLRETTLPGTGKQLHLVQFSGPVKNEWYAQLQATGVRIVEYIPHNAYLVYGDAASLSKVIGYTKSAAEVQWDGPYLDDYKLNPTVFTTANADGYQVQLVEDAQGNAETLARVGAMERGKLIDQRALGYVDLVVHTDLQSALSLAKQPDVVSIYPYVTPRKLDERADVIAAGQLDATGSTPTGPGHLAWLASKGFTQAQFDATNVGVDVSDSGIDNGTQLPNHFALYKTGDVTGTSRVVYNRLIGTPNTGSTLQGCDGHGNLNTHIIAAYNNLTGAIHQDAAGYRYGLGIAPFVRVGSSIVFDPNTFTNPNYESLQSQAYRDGMRVSSNSWGAATNTYTSDSQRYDALVRDAQPAGSTVPAPGNQEMIIVFAAGNGGSGAGTVGEPSTAKNVITAGAAENVHPFGAADQCGIADTGADSANDIISFSSRGPTSDGRIKPDLMAAGTHVSGGVAQAAGQRANPPAVLTGSQLACFDATGVCAGPGTSNFWPTTQQWTTASSGTSHSTPLIAGAAMLTRQYIINTLAVTPSPALVKGWLMNAARYMTGTGANDNLYSNNQGMGHLNLGFAFDGTPRFLRDEAAADLFTATGQTRTFNVFVADASKPLRVTLAWTDAPGSTTGNAFNNNLDLTVTVSGNTYRGNVFTGRNSVTGGVADTRNNVESVFLPAGAAGGTPTTVTVTATNIASDGVPGNASALDQDFALIGYNACPTLGTAPTGVTATSIAPNQIRIGWTAAPGVTDYRILRSTASGGPYASVGSVAAPATTFTDATAQGGQAYFYVVRGVNCAESGNSNEASATTTGTCTQPPTFAGATSATSAGASTCGDVVAWSPASTACGGTITYNVYRSRNATFTPSQANLVATGVAGTSYTDTANLAYGTTYYYIVHAVETSSATFEDANTARVSTSPTGPSAPALRYFDDLDGNRPANGDAYWVFTDAHIKKSSCRFQSSSTTWRFGSSTAGVCPGTYDASVDTRLVLGGNGGSGINGFAFPANSPSGVLAGAMTFRHAWDFNDVIGTTFFDGASLEFSTTGSTGPWTAVGTSVSTTAPYITSGGYTGTISTLGAVWTGLQTPANGSFFTTTVDVSGLAGRTAWFAWHYHSDSSVNREGHYLDDVSISADIVASCSTGSAPPGPAVSYVVGLPSVVFRGTPTGVPITALDSAEQVATGYNGTANLTSSDAAATLAPASFTAGQASATVTFNTAGAQTLTATDTSASSITGTASTTVINSTGHLSFTAQPSNAVAGATIAPAIRVAILDSTNAVVTGANNPITLTIGNNPGGGTLRGTVTVNAVAGIATFSNVNIRETGAGYTLVAASNGITSATSNPFNITPDVPAALAFAQQPTSTAAGASISPAVTVRINDQFGNLTASTANVTLIMGNNPGGGTLSGSTISAAAAGVATFSNLSINKAGAGYTLSASSGTLPSNTSSAFNITAAAANKVAFSQQPSSIAAGNPITPAVMVQVRDQFDNLVSSFNGDISVILGGGTPGATLLGTTTVTATGGAATFPDLSVDKAGNIYTLTAGAAGLLTATSVSFNVTAGAPASLAFVTQPPASRQAGQAFGASVAILDQFNNRTNSTAAVSLAISNNPGGGTLSGASTVNAVNGLATFAGLSIDKVGNGYTLDAGSGALAGATSNPFNITPGAAAALAFGQQPSNAVAGVNISPAIAVRVVDAFGNLVPSSSASVSLAVGNNPGGDTLHGTTTATASGGVATFGAVSLQKSGAGYTVVASATGLASATSTGFDISAAAAASLAYSVQPSTTTAGATIAPAVAVQARDAFGNLATGFTGAVSVSLTNANGATLAGTTTVNAVAGTATYADLSIAKSGLGYQLAAASTGLTGATSASFDVTAGAPASLSFFTNPPGSIVAGSSFLVTVEIQDALGNRTTSTAAVSLAIGNNPGGGTLSGTTTVNAVNGLANFPGLSIDKAGTGYTLDATSTGLVSATSSAFDIRAAAAASLAFGTQPSSAVAGAAISPAVTVRILDQFGNLTTSTATVTVAIGNNPGGGTLSGTAGAAASGGVATFADLSIDKVGAGYTLDASSGTLTGASSSAFDITPAAAASLAFAVQPSTTVAGATIAPAVVLQARDAFGNLATGFAGAVQVALTNAGSATLAGTTSVNAAAGAATFSDLSVARAGTGYQLVAASTGLTGATSSAFDIVPGPAAALVFTTQPVSGPANAAFSAVVAVSDALGNLVTGATNTITVAIGNNPSGGTLSGTLSADASGGVATFSDLSIDKAGLGYTLTATAGGLTSATSAVFDIGAGPAVSLEFVVQPSSAVAGVAISPAIGVRAVDASGNTASTGDITLAIGNNAGGGTLSGTTTVTPISGMATFSDLSIDKAGAGYTLRATSGALSATSAAFNITSAAAGALVFSVQPSNAASGAAIAPAVVVTAVDAFGNTDTSFTGSVSLTLGGGAAGATLAGTTTASAAGGSATFSDLSIAKAGTGYTLTAAATGLTSATSSAFNIASGAATHLAIVGLAAGVQITVETSFSIEARDANDNVAAGYAGTVRITSDDAQAALPPNQTLATGAISGVKITFHTAGTHTVTATDTTTASITGTASTNVTAFAAPAVTLDGAADGDTVDAAVHLTATGSAASGTTLTRLEIFVDGASLVNAATSPLPADWDTKDLPNGSTHVLTATATDATGNSTTTAPINVTVQHKGCGCSEMGGLDVGALAALGVVIRALALRRRRAAGK